MRLERGGLKNPSNVLCRLRSSLEACTKLARGLRATCLHSAERRSSWAAARLATVPRCGNRTAPVPHQSRVCGNRRLLVAYLQRQRSVQYAKCRGPAESCCCRLHSRRLSGSDLPSRSYLREFRSFAATGSWYQRLSDTGVKSGHPKPEWAAARSVDKSKLRVRNAGRCCFPVRDMALRDREAQQLPQARPGLAGANPAQRDARDIVPRVAATTTSQLVARTRRTVRPLHRRPAVYLCCEVTGKGRSQRWPRTGTEAADCNSGTVNPLFTE